MNTTKIQLQFLCKCNETSIPTKADILSKYFEILDGLVRLSPDCVLPIKNLEKAMFNCYVENGGSLQCSPNSNPRHESEE